MDIKVLTPALLACQDWTNTKAAYRFFSNDRVGEADILAGHFQSTRGRFVAAPGPILVLQDTTEFTYQRESTDAIGMTYIPHGQKTRRPATSSCGEVYPVSPIPPSAFNSEPNLWVIESFAGRLRLCNLGMAFEPVEDEP